jgi:hypothetical protein
MAGELVACAKCDTPMNAPAVAGGKPKPFQSAPPAPAAAPKTSAKKLPLAKLIPVIAVVLIAGGILWWMQSRPPATKKTATKKAAPKAVAAVPAPALPAARSLPSIVTGRWKFDGPAAVNACQFGGTGKEQINDIVARDDGRLVMAGTLTALDGIPTATKRHQLIDKQSGAVFGFVAELSPDGQTVNWFSTFGGDLFQPNRIALGPDGTIHLGGKRPRQRNGRLCLAL